METEKKKVDRALRLLGGAVRILALTTLELAKLVCEILRATFESLKKL